MRNGEQTRENILRQAAELFNRQGFAGASLSDIMSATGLQKGGIYRHFESKEALALEAFDYAVRRMGERLAEALAGRAHAVDRLRAVIAVYGEIPENPPVPGGCPVMNAAIENDHGNPALRERACRAMDGLRGLIRRNVRDGITRGEVRPGTDPEEVATVLVSTLEGAVMLSQLYGDPEHVGRATRHLEWYLEESVRA
ncbi:MAG TPA: TetR/AcrR family transcriptional regulator [Longimicrobiaceae bacterium]|nr:TetR/AcrR family transcriptional regulator [Longimicrobiaceae bacterium]